MSERIKRTVIPKQTKRAVLERDGNACVDCGVKKRVIPLGYRGNTNLHVHHIIEFQNGGSHDIDNLVTLCSRCHRRHDLAHVLKLRRETVERKQADRLAKGLINYKEACALLGVSYPGLQGLIWKHKLKDHSERHTTEKLLNRADVLALLGQSRRAA